MELNVKEQTEKLQGEALQIAEKIVAVRRQIEQLQRTLQLLINESLKNQGASNLLQSLEGDKLKEK